MKNKVSLIGRVGSDPELKSFDNGNKVASFSLATSEKFKSKDGIVTESTEWHNIKIWNNIAEIASKFLKKGDLVSLEGKIKTETWEKDGQKQYKTTIVCDEIVLLPNKREETSQASQHSTTTEQELPQVQKDDLPF